MAMLRSAAVEYVGGRAADVVGDVEVLEVEVLVGELLLVAPGPPGSAPLGPSSG